MASSVEVVLDKDSLQKARNAAGQDDVVCVIFSADFAKPQFTKDTLATVASSQTGVKRLYVDMNDESGEELACDEGVGSKLPVARLYRGASTELAFEISGPECQPSVVESRIKQMQKGGLQAAATDGGIRGSVRAAYAATVTGGQAVIPNGAGNPQARNDLLGYKDYDVTESADLGLGCGNPLITAKLQKGEIVCDLGSGAGMDCFIAAKEVGPGGHVIGVDMTPEMLSKARATARKDGVTNVSFRLGEIEHLPLGDKVVDCVISNCVINLSPEKPQVYREMNRILKPGGRVSISDVLRTSEIPPELQTAQSYSCWVAGASDEDEMRNMLIAAGFSDVSVVIKENAAEFIKDWMPGSGAEKFITSAYVTATKAAGATHMADDVRVNVHNGDYAVAETVVPSAGAEMEAGCWG